MNKNEISLHEEITSTPEGMRIWQQERVIIEVTERICHLMQQQGVSRSQLADRLGKSRGHITQFLSGNANMTLRSISDIYLALGRQFHADDRPIATDDYDARAQNKRQHARVNRHESLVPTDERDTGAKSPGTKARSRSRKARA